MTKRKSSRKKVVKQSRVVMIITYSVVFILFLMATGGTGYYFGYSDGKKDTIAAYTKTVSKQKEAAVVSKQTQPRLKKQLREVLKHGNPKVDKTASHEYSSSLKKVDHPPKGPVRPLRVSGELPRLAIIIDDVSFASDVRKIKALNLPVTMSFLPPTANHPDSAKLAARESYYMVHLPMEAKNFSSPEPETLHVRDSQQQILERIDEIKQLFPKVEYINNHTGSTFTSDETAMNRLVFALRKEKIGFIDSRTTAKTIVPFVMKNFGLAYIARDIFLDHDPDISAIKKQIKKAVDVARKHGYAIAIGHPHKETLEALRQSKGVLEQVQLVQIDSLL